MMIDIETCICFWKNEFVYYMKKQVKLRKKSYFTLPFFLNFLIIMLQLLSHYIISSVLCSFCLHFSGHAALSVITYVSILQPQLFLYIFFKFSISCGFKLILSVFDVVHLIAPYFPPVLTFFQPFSLYPLFLSYFFFPFLSFVCMGFFLFPLLFQLDFPVGGLQASFRNIIGTSCSVIFH